MADEIISNLEPIENEDLALKEKFIGGEKKETKVEQILPKEIVPERKEGVVEKEDAYSKILSKVPAPTKPVEEHDVKKDAEVANVGIDAESKVNNLVKIAEAKGVFHAVKVAKHMENFYV